MIADTAIRVCANDACQYVATRKCVEGNPVEECPHLKAVDHRNDGIGDDAEIDTEVGAGPDTSVAYVTNGEPLTVADGSAVLKFGRASVVALVGQAEAGKTSLIGEVYDAFQYGAYEELTFAGSRTLIGFEKICHKIRATSRGHNLLEERTDVTSDPVLFHLSVARNHDETKDLLIADRSGETYRDMLDRPSLAMGCIELRRASVLNLLVDGARLTDPSERASVITECQQVMQTLVHSALVDEDRRINVVLTKLDEVDGSPEKRRCHLAFESIVDRVRSTIFGTSAKIGVYRIAARPRTELYAKGFGVEALVIDWLNDGFAATPYEGASYENSRAFEMVGQS